MATVLAIEDRQDNLTALSPVLERLIDGCTVITAQSGAEGIEKAIAELPDAILLDVIKPGMDGYEVCKRLKSDERTKYIPVIMLSSIQTDSESRVRGLEIGADAFLTKPIDEVELVAQVNAMLRIKRAEDLLRNVYGFDVTERRRTQGLLKERETKLFQSHKMEAFGTLVPEVAHELNNPITLILFNVPLLQEIWHDLQPVVAKYARHEPHRKYGGLKYEYLRKGLGQLLDDMDLASNRIANTVSGLKNFARHSDVADKKPMLINDAVTNAVLLSQASVRRAGIDMVTDLSDDLAPVNGDPKAMEQIILNLILNAVEAIDHEHGRIKITSGFEEKTEKIFVSVSDDGAGVDPDIAHRVFDPLVTSKMAKNGTGLGLSITHKLVRAHSGAITFQNRNGKGTTFTVSFPSALKEKRAKILVVDDDREIRETLAEALTTLGPYLVDKAPNGVEACIKLGTNRPDLIVLDVFMPEMDGLEVCHKLKREPELSDIKVLITTALPDHPKVKEIAELGYRNVCYKPFTIKDFVNRVDKCLRHSN